MYKIFKFENISDAAPFMDKKAFDYIQECQTEGFECFDDFDLLAFDFYDVKSDKRDTAKLMIYFDKIGLFFFCENDFMENKVTKTLNELNLQPLSSPAHILYLFFARILKADINFLQNFEQTLSDEEDFILSNANSSDTKQMINRRKELLRLKRYYSQLSAIFDELCENENRIVSPAYVRRFSALKNRSERYLNTVVNLQEIISQLREAYQSQLTIRQNDLMQLFTVVTVIFLPLSLIAGWYGMNFTNMPELKWHYGYGCIIFVSIALVIFLIWFFKRKKWL